MVTITGWDKPSKFRQVLARRAKIERLKNTLEKVRKITKKVGGLTVLKPKQFRQAPVSFKHPEIRGPPTGKIRYENIIPGDSSHLDEGSIIPKQPPRRIRWV